jgi:16S rRNA (cytosine1402-N4)-methyltransferase
MSETSGSSDSRSPARHVPVLMREVLQSLELQPGLIVVDGTVGAGGHSREILKQIGPEGTLIGLDRDPFMLALAAQKVSGPNCHLIQSSYAQLPQVLAQLEIPAVDRILLDLGLSSDQLADDARGFSFRSDGPLDLRFDVLQGESAAEWLQHVEEAELVDVLQRYGEERNAGRIARYLVQRRKTERIATGTELAAAVCEALGIRGSGGDRHPATQVFQALRIAVNAELQQVEEALKSTLHNCLKPGGILAVISFHSLEDRIVKHTFREAETWEILLHKPVVARSAEQRLNPRSRTAKLRAARKL